MKNDLMHDPEYAALKESIIRYTGLAYYSEKDDALADKIRARWNELDIRSYGEYGRFLFEPRGIAELERLIGDLTIGETYFFRHPEQFEAMKTLVIPDLLRENAESRRLRIWSVGCATGAETYSISILLKDEFGAALRDWDVQIVGTDINRDFLKQAEEGEFGAWTLRSMPEDRIKSAFTPSASQWELKPEYKRWTRFQYHNLADRPFLPPEQSFDLILCRNVMIYFDSALIRYVLENFKSRLKDKGWLLTGHAENGLEYQSYFQTIRQAQVILYRNVETRGFKNSLSSAADDSMAEFEDSAYAAMMPEDAEDYEKKDKPLPSDEKVEMAARPSAILNADFPARVHDDASTIRSEVEEIRRLIDLADWNEAEERCRTLALKDPLDSHSYYYQSLIYEGRGLFADAEKAVRRAIYLDRQSALGHFHLGRFLEMKGDLDGSKRALQNALKILNKKSAEDALRENEEMSVGQLRFHAETLLKYLNREETAKNGASLRD